MTRARAPNDYPRPFVARLIGVLLVVAVLAALIPAGRAVAVDPATTLRTE